MLVLHMKVDKVSDEEDDKVAKGTLVTLVSQVNLGRVGGSNSRSCSCTFCILQDLHPQILLLRKTALVNDYA